MFRHSRLLMSLAISVVAVEIACAQVPPDKIEQLVEQLAHPSFAQREAAAIQLDRLGPQAKPALMRSLQRPSLEMRLGAEAVLNRLLQREFESRLVDFVEGRRDVKQVWLPCWEDVRQSFGDDRTTRALYAEMMRDEGALLFACEAEDPELTESFRQRLRSLQPFDEHGKYAPKRSTDGTFGTLLLVAGAKQLRKQHAGFSELVTLLTLSETIRLFQSSSYQKPLRRLLDRFVLQLAESSWNAGGFDAGRYYALDIAMRYDLKDRGVATARRALVWTNSPPRILRHALLAIGKFGGRDDISLVQSHLANRAICHTTAVAPDAEQAQLQVQVRDIALAIEIHLHGAQPQEYGFELMERESVTLFAPHTCGFRSPGDRQAAIARWRQAASSIKPRPFSTPARK